VLLSGLALGSALASLLVGGGAVVISFLSIFNQSHRGMDRWWIPMVLRGNPSMPGLRKTALACHSRGSPMGLRTSLRPKWEKTSCSYHESAIKFRFAWNRAGKNVHESQRLTFVGIQGARASSCHERSWSTPSAAVVYTTGRKTEESLARPISCSTTCAFAKCLDSLSKYRL
jgi:hypothetical protein